MYRTLLRSGMIACCVASFLAGRAYAQSSGQRKIHLIGRQARELISLLVSGSEDIRNSIKDSHQNTIAVHKLAILAEATGKYDSDDPYYALDVYSATGQIGSTEVTAKIGEAAALYSYFTRLGLKPDTALEGSYLMFGEIDCRVYVDKLASAPDRFRCDVTVDP